MKKVITYGTYDLLHYGHENLLKRAKELGDYLIVGVTSDSFDKDRGKLNVRNNVLERVEAVRRTGYADEIIIEDYVGQKIDDIQKYDVDVFAIGSDWEGKFDYLKEYCEVVYLPRTEGISSTELRNKDVNPVKLGIVGCGRIAERFIKEAVHVSGAEVVAAYDTNESALDRFAKLYSVRPCCDIDSLLDVVDGIYVATPHTSHYFYSKKALLAGKHVLCEIPLALKREESEELFQIASGNRLVYLEASKTAHFPAWNHLLVLVKSGIIGDVIDVKASLSKLVASGLRELDDNQAGGSMTELGPIPLMAIVKLLGTDMSDIQFYSKFHDGVDIFTRANIVYPGAVASVTLGLGVKTEGNLVVSGTKGYVLVPSPWWLTNFFEVNFEDRNKNKKYFYSFEGDGLRYELQEFISMIIGKRTVSYRLNPVESLTIVDVIDKFRSCSNLHILE